MQVSPYINTKQNIVNRLKQEKFFVVIPKIYIYTEQELKIYGIPLEEVNGKDNTKANLELVDSYKSVYDLAKIAAQDGTIKIKNESDMVKIIEIVTEALDLLENAPGIVDEDLEELIMALNIFKNKVLDVNENNLQRLYKKQDKTENYLNDTFGGFEFSKKITKNIAEVTDVTNVSKPRTNRKFGIDFSIIERI